jgi:hypothetical protein
VGVLERLYLNHKGKVVHSNKFTANTIIDVRIAEDVATILHAPWLLGLAWHTFSLVLTGSGLASTIKTCKQNKGQSDNIFYCVMGLLSTIVGMGDEVSPAKKFAK